MRATTNARAKMVAIVAIITVTEDVAERFVHTLCAIAESVIITPAARIVRGQLT
jgi:hypothetical protein